MLIWLLAEDGYQNAGFVRRVIEVAVRFEDALAH